MMKKNTLISLFLFLIFGLFQNSLYADSITAEIAKKAAISFYTDRAQVADQSIQNESLVFSLFENADKDNFEAYYIFNVNGDKGFVIVAADDDAYPILGYSFIGSYDPAKIAPATTEMMSLFTNQIVEIQAQNLEGSEIINQQWQALLSPNYSSKSITSVDPLLTTTWSQGTYYNTDCPADAAGDDGHVLVGCVATAMAQILKYHSYPPSGTGSHTYVHDVYGSLTANYGNSTYNWSSMPNSASSYNDALALIGYHCGVSVEMDYGTDGSGAWTGAVANALVNYFDYDASVQYVYKENYSSSDWENLLKNEIDNSQPIEYRGGGPDGGHAFVIDGYQGASNNHFHFNWGWGGYADGYFYVSNLNPGGYTFNDGQAAVIGIVPNGNTNTAPSIDNPVSDANLSTGFGTHSINISNVFDDADGDPLTYSVVSSNTSVVGVSVSGTTLTLTENGNGTSIITLTANDGNGGTVDDVFNVTVSGSSSFDPPINLSVTENGYATWDAPGGGTTEGLWNQMDNPGEDGGISTQDFTSSNDIYDAEGADDFVVPAGETWTITEVDVLGSYSADGGPCDLANVRIYADASGIPGNVLYEYLDVDATPDADGNLYCVIPSSELTEGTYWISVQGDMEYAIGGQWFWSRQATPLIGSEFFWRCPLDGFANGFTTWTTGSVSYADGTAYDLAFALYGTLSNDGKTIEYTSAKRTTNTKVSATTNNIITGKPTLTGPVTLGVRTLLGYNVYLDDNNVQNTTNLYYQYAGLVEGNTYTAGVSALYDGGESAIIEYEFTVPGSNSVPTVANPISDVNLDEGFGTHNINISNVFDDADGDDLTYSVVSSNTAVVGASVSGTAITITENTSGSSSITITADDGNGGTVDDVFSVVVGTTSFDPPTNLSVTEDAYATWEAPGGSSTGFTDDFESYTDFVLEFSPWTQVDIDGSETYGFEGSEFENEYYIGSYIIFNPSTVDPPLEDVIPHSGDKMAACFAATDLLNNDWMISPQVTISSGDEVSFWAKSFTADYGLERFNVAVSTTGTDPGDFTVISGATYAEAPIDWTEFSYGLSAYDGQDVYVAIQCVTADAFILFIDDVHIGAPSKIIYATIPVMNGSSSKNTGVYIPGIISSPAPKSSMDLLGYNVYLDDNYVQNTTNLYWQYTGLTEGNTYTAGVSALYDGGESAIIEYEFTIPNTNSAPIVVNPIADVNLDEGFGTHNIDISNVFDDADGDPLTYSVVSSNTGVVGASVSGNTITITENTNGSSNITVTADDGNGGTVDDVFTVTVSTTANNPPVVVNPISDVDLDEGFATHNIDFSTVFNDPDDDDLSYSVSSSNSTVVTVSISGNLVITEVGNGTSIITLTADDGNGGSVDDVFTVNVNAAANNPPVVVNPISDVELDEGFATHNIDFSTVFNDPDNDDLSYSVSSSNLAVVTASISGTLVITEVGNGTSIITLTANDGNGGSVNDVFTVIVNPAPNNAPEVVNPLSDLELEQGFDSIEIDISGVFNDVDGDDLTYTVEAEDDGYVLPTISGDNIILTEQWLSDGGTNITLTANDGNGGIAEDVFYVFIDMLWSVNELDISDIKIHPNPSSGIVNISINNHHQSMDLIVYDILGEKILEKENVDSEKLSIDLSDNEKGIYLIKIVSDKQSFIKKIIIK